MYSVLKMPSSAAEPINKFVKLTQGIFAKIAVNAKTG
jgi:hypothetical protein